MACLGSVLYDPTTSATVSTAAATAMTAMDTTNARITFTVPANGIVLVRIRVAEKGATTQPMVLLGVLEGATVRGRQVPLKAAKGQTSANSLIPREAVFLVTGLTPGANLTWDAAYGVEFGVTSSTLGWGGANDTTANNAFGGLSFEVWETTNLLAGVMYDPATAASKSTTSATALAAFDTTNLRLTFTPPASGRVLVRIRVAGANTTGTCPGVMLGVLSGATVKGRQMSSNIETGAGTAVATDWIIFQSEFVVSGLSGSQTWDAAWGIEFLFSGGTLNYGGPNNTTASDAWGGAAFEVWSA